MSQFVRFVPVVIVACCMPLAATWAADTAPSSQTSSGTIIWDAAKSGPAPATQGPNGTIIWNDGPTAKSTSQSGPTNITAAPDKNGITWDSPSAPSSASSAPPASTDKNGITWNGSAQTARARTVPAMPSPSNTASNEAGPCREFQTHIMIDGKSEPAHGTACRQPDGTWRVVNR